jgi:FMN phosphatase YigB (HAD superfamily)
VKSRPQIRLLVTDLDNTLYDWITFFSEAFSRMVAVASEMLEVSEEQLLDELRGVHQESGNTEQPFALAYTRTVCERLPDRSLAERVKAMGPAFEAFNQVRRERLVLYPGVRETLREVQRRGVPIVGLTDAMWPNAHFRLRLLGIEEVFDHLYAPGPDDTRWSDPMGTGGYGDRPVRLEMLRTSERKPSASGLCRICSDLEVPHDQTLYVGDSLARDVGMARTVGVRTAWAAFGQVFDLGRWEKVARVTHWSEEEVARDRDSSHGPDGADGLGGIEPEVILKESLAEILDAFDFGAGEGFTPPPRAHASEPLASTCAHGLEGRSGGGEGPREGTDHERHPRG